MGYCAHLTSLAPPLPFCPIIKPVAQSWDSRYKVNVKRNHTEPIKMHRIRVWSFAGVNTPSMLPSAGPERAVRGELNAVADLAQTSSASHHSGQTQIWPLIQNMCYAIPSRSQPPASVKRAPVARSEQNTYKLRRLALPPPSE